MKKWLVRLNGDIRTLEQLPVFCMDEMLKVEKIGLDFCLSSTQLEGYIDDRQVYERGEELIKYLNWMLMLCSNRYNFIESNGYCVRLSDGSIDVQFLAIGDLYCPMTVSVHSYEIPSSCSILIFERYPSVRYVLEQINGNAPNWFNLYFVFETIKSDEQLKREYANGQDAIRLWGGEEDMQCFLGTANWHRHSDYERSNLEKNRLPKNPMTLGMAYNYIRSLTVAWLSFKSGNLFE